MIKMSKITDVIRCALIDSGKFEHVQYIGKCIIEVKLDGIYYNIEPRGSLANLFG